ncbi:mdm2 [Symbiodinium sp. CCMP2456]|nr:mdm2 [Symbiodinium sp. CCMP2456]
MFSGPQKQVLRTGDRVRANFQNRYGSKSSATDVGTLLQFTTSEVEIHFDDGAVQCVSKTWIAERLSAWDLDLAPGDIVYAHYASGKGRTVNTDLGIVVAVLDGGRVRIRFQDQIMQTIPMGWVEQVMRLEPGDRVNAYFKVNDGRGAKSVKTDMGSVLAVSKEDVYIVFDDNVEQNVPKTWVCHRARPWNLQVEVGSVADVHFEVGEDGRRSTSTDIGIVLSDPIDGRVQVQFQDTIQQTVPLGWIVRLREWAVGDRVQAHFKTGGGEKSTDTDVATVMSSSLLEVDLYFDDGIQQNVSKAWVTERVRDWHAEVSELSSGDVVIAHFKRPGNHCRSVQTDRGIVLTILQRGEVSVMFQDDITQVIPKGWIQAVATRWSGQRDEFARDKAEIVSFESSKQRSQRIAPANSTECVICMDAKPNGVIVHGDTCHQSTCYTCAKRLQRAGDSCPICREVIDQVCKLHGDVFSSPAALIRRLSAASIHAGLDKEYNRFCRVTMKGPEDYRTIRLEPSAVRCRPAEAWHAGRWKPPLGSTWSFSFALAVEKSVNCYVNVGLVEWKAARKEADEDNQQDPVADAASTQSLADILKVKSDAEDEVPGGWLPEQHVDENPRQMMLGCRKGVQWFGNAAKYPLFQDNIMAGSLLRFRCDYHLNRQGDIAQVKIWMLASPIHFEYGGEHTVKVGSSVEQPGEEDSNRLGACSDPVYEGRCGHRCMAKPRRQLDRPLAMLPNCLESDTEAEKHRKGKSVDAGNAARPGHPLHEPSGGAELSEGVHAPELLDLRASLRLQHLLLVLDAVHGTQSRQLLWVHTSFSTSEVVKEQKKRKGRTHKTLMQIFTADDKGAASLDSADLLNSIRVDMHTNYDAGTDIENLSQKPPKMASLMANKDHPQRELLFKAIHPASSLEAWMEKGLRHVEDDEDEWLEGFAVLPTAYKGCNKESLLVYAPGPQTQVYPVPLQLADNDEGIKTATCRASHVESM